MISTLTNDVYSSKVIFTLTNDVYSSKVIFTFTNEVYSSKVIFTLTNDVSFLQVWFQNRRAKFRRNERNVLAQRNVYNTPSGCGLPSDTSPPPCTMMLLDQTAASRISDGLAAGASYGSDYRSAAAAAWSAYNSPYQSHVANTSVCTPSQFDCSTGGYGTAVGHLQLGTGSLSSCAVDGPSGGAFVSSDSATPAAAVGPYRLQSAHSKYYNTGPPNMYIYRQATQ